MELRENSYQLEHALLTRQVGREGGRVTDSLSPAGQRWWGLRRRRRELDQRRRVGRTESLCSGVTVGAHDTRATCFKIRGAGRCSALGPDSTWLVQGCH